MESNLEDNITQSQSEKNPQKSKGNSRRKKILCKKHETGRKGQNKVNPSENTTLQQQYERGEISFQDLCQAILNQKDNPISRKEKIPMFEDNINNLEDDIEDDNAYRIKAAWMLHNYLTQKHKARKDYLFGIFKIPLLGLGIRYKLGRTFNNEYEYEKSLVKDDEQEAWFVVLFVALMNAYGIDNEDLLTVGRQAEELSKRYCKEIESVATSKNEMQLEKPLVYNKIKK